MVEFNSAMYDYFIEEVRKVPMVRLFLPFLMGMILHETAYPGAAITLVLFMAVFFLLIYVWFTKRISYKYSLRWVFGLIVYFSLILSGALYMDVYESKPYLYDIDTDTPFLIADVNEWPEERERTFKLLLSVKAGLSGDSVFSTSGMVLAYVSKDSLSSTLRMGDRLVLNNKFEEVTNNNNPFEFDYRRYLHNQGIRKQAFLREGDWVKIDSLKGNPVRLFAGNLRQRLLKLYARKGLKNDEFAVASALTLGYRAALDEDIRRSYSSSGAMHVLAVSGLHVGIIYFVLNYLLKFLVRLKGGILLRVVILLISLWFYAFLTGLSPSVLRASTMFTFVIIGGSLKRPSNIYNTLAASAFFLVLLNPYIIKAVGFQLSYMAVLGIVFFQPRIYKQVYIKNKLLDKIWALTCVSIGAQLGTFPLSLYYFQQFPNLFFISNLVVIPMATLILYSGIALFIFSFIPPLADILAFILNWSVWLLNCAVRVIENIPFSHTTGLFIFGIQLPLLYLLVILLTNFLIQRQIVYLRLVLVNLLLLIGIWSCFTVSSIYSRQLIVLNAGNQLVVNYIGSGQNLIITTPSGMENKRQLEYLSRGVWSRYKAPVATYHTLYDTVQNFVGNELFGYRHFWNFNGISVVIADANFPGLNKPQEPFPVDYLIVSGRKFLQMEQLLDYMDPEMVILSSCVPAWHMERYRQNLEEFGKKHFFVRTQGAFVLKI